MHFDGKKRIFVGKEKCIIEDVLAVVTNEVMGDACRLVPLLLSLPGRRHHQPPPPPPLAPLVGLAGGRFSRTNVICPPGRPEMPQADPRNAPGECRFHGGTGPGAQGPGFLGLLGLVH